MKRGIVSVLGTYIIWGLFPLFWRYLNDIASYGVVGYRIFFNLLVVSIYLTAAGKWKDALAVLRNKRERRWLIASGVALVLNWFGFVFAVASSHVLDSSLAYYMYPVLSLVVGAVFFREKLGKLQWLAAGLMAVGVAVAAVRYGQIPWLALFISCTFVLYGALKRTVRCEAAVSLFVESLVMLPVSLVLIGVCEASGSGALAAFSGAQFLLLPMAGVVSTVPLVLFSNGIRQISYTLAGLMMPINPTLQLLVGVFLMGETFTATHGILFVFIWSGFILFMVGNHLGHKKALR